MAINKKLIHFKSKELFNTELANGNILDSSIVFIKDTLEIWTHGQLYKTLSWSILPNDIIIENLPSYEYNLVTGSTLYSLFSELNESINITNLLSNNNISDQDPVEGTTNVDFLQISKHDNKLGFGVNNATYNHWWKNTSLANMVKISDGGGLINLEVFYCGSTTYEDLKKANGWNLVPSNSLYAILEDYKNEVSNIPVITADNIEGSGFNLNGGLLNLYNCKIDIPDSDEKFYGYFAVMPQPQIILNSANENGSNSPIYFKDNNLNTLSVYITPNSINTLANLNNLYSRNLVTGEFLQTALDNVTDYVSEATTTKKGAMSSTDKTKLDAIPNTIISNITGNTDAPGEGFTLNITGTSITSDNIGRETESSVTIPVASGSADGLMSVFDKNKLDSIPNKVASLDSAGKVPTSLLPSYVDDVLEYTTSASFPNEGETGKIYVDTTTNLTYRWSGTQYIEISPSLALGTTSSTAYPGNLGASLLASFDDLLSNVNEFADRTSASIETLNTLVSTITSNVATNTGNIKKVTNQVSSLQDTVNNIPTTIDSHIDDFVASRTLIVDGSSLNWSASLSTTATSVSTLQTPTKANILNNDFDVILKVNANVRVKALPLESISNHISGTTSIVTTYEAIITTGSINSSATIKVTRTSAGVISSVTVAKTGASNGTLASRVTGMLAAVDDIYSSVNTLNTNVSNLQTSVNELEKSYIIGYIPSSGTTLTITKNNLSDTNWKNGNVDLYITTSTSTTTLTRVAKAAFKYSLKTSSTIYNVYSYTYGGVEYEIALNILNTTTTPSINGTVTKLGPVSSSYPDNSCVIDLSSVDITTITNTTHTEVAAAKTPKYGRVRDLTSCPLLLFKNNVIVRPHLTYEFLTPGTNCSYTYLINGSFGKVEVIILLNSTHTEILSVKYKKAS